MRLKPFYLTAQSLHCDLDLWPFDPKVHRAHTWLMGRLHVKFHEDRCKGEAFMRLKPFYLTTRLQTDGRMDRQTDGQGDSSIPPPPNFVAGGYNYLNQSTITPIVSSILAESLDRYFYSALSGLSIETSILKVFLKQYMSPTGPTNFKEVQLLQEQIKGYNSQTCSVSDKFIYQISSQYHKNRQKKSSEH